MNEPGGEQTQKHPADEWNFAYFKALNRLKGVPDGPERPSPTDPIGMVLVARDAMFKLRKRYSLEKETPPELREQQLGAAIGDIGTTLIKNIVTVADHPQVGVLADYAVGLTLESERLQNNGMLNEANIEFGADYSATPAPMMEIPQASQE